jgi:hypothetical protein
MKVLKLIVNNPKVAITTQTAVDDKPFVYFEDGKRFESPAVGDDNGKELDEIFVDSSWYDFLHTYIYPTVKNVIMYECPVNLIDYSSNKNVYVECINGIKLKAKNVTASVQILRSEIISFRPPLPLSVKKILKKFKFRRIHQVFK